MSFCLVFMWPHWWHSDSAESCEDQQRTRCRCPSTKSISTESRKPRFQDRRPPSNKQQATSNKAQSPKPHFPPSQRKSRRMRRPRARRRRPSALRSLPSCGTGAPWPQPRRSPRSSAGPAPRRRETTRRRHDDFSETLLSLASLTAAPRGDARRSHCHENLRLRYVGCEKSRKLR